MSEPPLYPTTKEAWIDKLGKEAYHVAREAGTEAPHGQLYKDIEAQGEGIYRCAGCGAELFSSKEKFHSGCGWPSFYAPSKAKNVKILPDPDGRRVEVRCAVCDSHLGHVFTGEGFETPTDQRYCINGIILRFHPKK